MSTTVPPPPARVSHVLETALYVADLDRAAAFYKRLFGFPEFLRDERMIALGVPGEAVLLLFLAGATRLPALTPGGTIPGHHGAGTQHLCFAIPQEDLPRWADWLGVQEVGIESRVNWPTGAVSLYFRDPDSHSIEVATPRLWPNYGR